MENKKLTHLLDTIQLKVIQAISALDKSDDDTRIFLFIADGYLESLKDRKDIKKHRTNYTDNKFINKKEFMIWEEI